MDIKKYAAIDIGSNAIRLLISNIVTKKGNEPQFKKSSLVRVPIRLGEDSFIKGFISEKTRILGDLDSVLTGDWTAKRLNVLMRMLLCTASFELIFETDVPKRVLISEYTDLAHAFFEDNEAAFAAGILSALTAKFRPE